MKTEGEEPVTWEANEKTYGILEAKWRNYTEDEGMINQATGFTGEFPLWNAGNNSACLTGLNELIYVNGQSVCLMPVKAQKYYLLFLFLAPLKKHLSL